MPHDVSVAEWAVLHMLWQQEGLTQVSLADRMRVQKSSLTPVLNDARASYAGRDVRMIAASVISS
jgi:DNA-binding MarR family transcriptional regulator